ncbi:MAG: PD-(D/E)XK nuclease family protein [Candidatus Woesearchaeota archaeon]|jgi:ATP-dependent exoDNAse (exonuclease V) beta subunit
MENIIIKDIVALLRLYDNKHDDVAFFKILSSKLFSIKRLDLSKFTKNVFFENYKNKEKKLHLIDGFQFVGKTNIDTENFIIAKQKIDIILQQKNILELIEKIFKEFMIIEQAELFDCKKRFEKLEQDIIKFVKEQGFVSIQDIINFVNTHNFELENKTNTEEHILLDIDYLLINAKMQKDKKQIEKLELKKEKVKNKSKDLDVSFYTEQIETNKYQKEKEMLVLPNFSATQFNMYDTCPNQYRCCYIYSIPTPKKYFFVFGGIMHKVIEELTKIIKDGKEVSENFGKQLLLSMWDSNGYQTEEQEKEYFATGEKMIEMFLKRQKELETELVSIEKKFTIEIERFKINGIIDRIDMEKGGEYLVIDYKTSKTEKDTESLRHDLQLLLYYDGLTKLYGKVPKMLCHWYLLSDNVVSVVPTINDLTNIRSKILDICTSILTEKFEPKKSNACEWCDFKLLCSKW